MPSDLQRTIAAHRRALAADERAARAELLRTYQGIQKRILARLESLQQAIRQRADAGEEVTLAWLQRQQRYRDLLTQVAAEMARLAQTTERVTTQTTEQAIDRAQVQSVEAIEAAMGDTPPGVSVSFNRLPRGAIQEALAAQQDGSPLRDLLDGFGGDASARARDALLNAVAQGIGPRETAREVRHALNVSMVRALTIARTEQLRAYRSASRESYKANSDVVTKWRWLSARSATTCALCYAMDGQEFDLDDGMDSHPNCRCVQVPVTKTWAELGISGVAESVPDIGTGEEAFARLDASDQRAILGRGKYELFQSGALRLRDLVARTTSRRWGRGIREKGLGEL